MENAAQKHFLSNQILHILNRISVLISIFSALQEECILRYKNIFFMGYIIAGSMNLCSENILHNKCNILNYFLFVLNFKILHFWVEEGWGSWRRLDKQIKNGKKEKSEKWE